MVGAVAVKKKKKTDKLFVKIMNSNKINENETKKYLCVSLRSSWLIIKS